MTSEYQLHACANIKWHMTKVEQTKSKQMSRAQSLCHNTHDITVLIACLFKYLKWILQPKQTKDLTFSAQSLCYDTSDITVLAAFKLICLPQVCSTLVLFL